jgi:aspartyl-tRNA(Asn)/glutamyl-tRNA(Gln) amidotransferase subunit C
MLNKQNISHLAELSRLRLTDTEALSLGKDLEGILDYVNQLADAKIDNLPDPSSGLSQNVVRDDAIPITNKTLAESIIENFPSKDGRNLKIPPVF